MHAWWRIVAAMAVIGAPAASAWADEPRDPKDVVITEEARRHFNTGVEYLEASGGPRYEEAYRAFRAAYRISPSPKILGNLGLCAMMLERDGEAIGAYRKYLALGDIPAAERREITRELEELEQNAVWLELQITPDGATIVDERVKASGDRVVNRYGPSDGVVSLRIRPGVHQLRIERTGHEAAALELEADAGERLTREVALTPIPAKPSPEPVDPAPELETGLALPPLVIGGLVLTGALGVTTGVLGGVAWATHGDYEDAQGASDIPRADELRDRGEALNIAADVLLGVTIASAVATVVIWIVSDDDEDTTTLSLRF